MIEEHVNSCHNQATSISQPYGKMGPGGKFIGDPRFLDLPALVRSYRLRKKTAMMGKHRGATGLRHLVYGHINKHLLRMKWLRAKEGIRLEYRF